MNTQADAGTEILMEADAVAGRDRSRDYGHPLQNHERIAAIWNVLIGKKLLHPIAAREVAIMMIGLKLAREVNSPKHDNLVDIAGYVKCVSMIDAAANSQGDDQCTSPFSESGGDSFGSDTAKDSPPSGTVTTQQRTTNLSAWQRIRRSLMF
jgi:hypothetical protein